MPRIIFKKSEEIKYISHLDLMRAFNRMLARAEIPVKYSEGFNPHVILNFALPLSVGMTSEKDFAEISLSEEMSNEEIKIRLQNKAPAGIIITDVTNDSTPEFKEVEKAEFALTVHCNKKSEDFIKFFKLPEILTDKKTKKGIKEVDIKPMILNFEIKNNDDNSIDMKLMLSAGNTLNLNPSLVIKAAEKYIPELIVEYVETKRLNLYTVKGEAF